MRLGERRKESARCWWLRYAAAVFVLLNFAFHSCVYHFGFTGLLFQFLSTRFASVYSLQPIKSIYLSCPHLDCKVHHEALNTSMSFITFGFNQIYK